MSRPALSHRAPRFLLLPCLLPLLACGGLSDGEAPPAADALVLDINGPRAVDHVRGESLLITVQTTGVTPERVELTRDGKRLAVLPPPFQYTWDVSFEPEGAYKLKARAEWRGRTYESPTHPVVVDRTPPTVVETQPQGNNVRWAETGVASVTFSEPMLSASVRSDQLSVTHAASSATLSEDGKTLSISYNSTREEPLTAILETSGLMDLAGNPLSAPSTQDQGLLRWSWQVPTYWESNPNTSESVSDGVALALGADGEPVVAYTAADLGAPSLPGEHLYVKRWTPTGWALQGSPLVAGEAVAETTVRHPRMVMGPGGRPVVAFLQGTGLEPGRALHVFQWEAGTWRPLGTQLNDAGGGRVHGAALAVDGEGRPVAAWSAEGGVHVVRWETDHWVALGTPRRASAADVGVISAQAPALAADAKGGVVVAWAESSSASAPADLHVHRWAGAGWTALGSGFQALNRSGLGVRAPALVIQQGQHPRVVWSEQSAPDITWQTTVFTATWSGMDWERLPVENSDSMEMDRGPVAVLDALGRPVYAWNGGAFGAHVHLATYPFGVQSVEQVGSSSGTGRLSMVMGAGNRPVVAWDGGASVHVAWYNQ
ncbi:Ig-like domain-containing protein [Myxococcus sp. RHSTA-1-4]|uniref:Ig-like domain-containing protein n=1 Tax=Myxococcus sp. RHSTA-1-4 TaxID=2874601 RepID=UPI001CBCCD8C|nr:Ig-like domain-containing protein [Myxococcus sp. RHSTA-1-4]MBZ4423016.1 Ig-like domain-containing protein [Myxococcus sp. RHSTA-1-4]